jgi:predicted RNase H-like HicB family nuclease
LLDDTAIGILNYMNMKQKKYKTKPPFVVEIEREEDKRWIAEVPKLPGVMAYGSTRQIALRRVYAVALRTLADNAEQGQLAPVSSLFNYDMARS